MDLKDKVLHCVKHPEDLEGLFGDGRLVEEAMQDDTPIPQIASFLNSGKTEHIREILRFFLEQQDKHGSVDISKRLRLVKECLRVGIGWDEEKDLVVAMPYGVFKPYFDILFSTEHIADTIGMFVVRDEYGSDHIESEDMDALGNVVGHIQDKDAQEYMRDVLIEHSYRSNLYGWLDHPVLGEKAYLNLKKDFINTIEGWKKDCPDLLKRMQKEQLGDVLDQLGVMDVTEKPKPSKKM